MVKRAAENSLAKWPLEVGATKRQRTAPASAQNARLASISALARDPDDFLHVAFVSFALPAPVASLGVYDMSQAILPALMDPLPSSSAPHAFKRLGTCGDPVRHGHNFRPCLRSLNTPEPTPLLRGLASHVRIEGKPATAGIFLEVDAGGPVPAGSSALCWMPRLQGSGARLLSLLDEGLRVETLQTPPSLRDFTRFMNQLAQPATELALTSAVAPSPFFCGKKRKREVFAGVLAEPKGPAAIQKLSTFEGNARSYVMTGLIVKGMAGKFRGAMCIETSEELGVKELRSRRAPPPKPGKSHKTVVTQDHDALMELQLLNLVSSKLRVHEVGECNGKIYLFLPWMAGDTCKLATARLSMPERYQLARSLAYQVAVDLEACHRAGYIHHDIKPSNILWGGDGSMAVSDFGLARRIDDARVGRPGGTPGMFAPEIVNGEVFGCESDMWSLGVSYLLFLMADVKCPLYWRGKTLADFKTAQSINQEFFTWRQGVTRLGPGEVSYRNRLEDNHGHLSIYFAEAMRRDAAMVRMILRHVLTPAWERDSSQVWRRRMERERLFDPVLRQAAQRATQRVADENLERRTIVGALRARVTQINAAALRLGDTLQKPAI